MINDDIAAIIDKMKQLEQQLEDELESRHAEYSYQLKHKKVKFERAIRELHRKYRIGLIEFLRTAELSHVLTAPVIYSLIVPLAFLDVAVNIYQHICFRAYGIPRVKRGDYIVIDRHHLAYLNTIEKINCVYCGYGNGLIAFAREVTARTEQYWCPIKHARRVLAPHNRIGRFADYGDAEDYQETLARLRRELQEE
ncbi:MAG: hypothetical protein J5I92_12660 [Thiogranum sp.]|nr:hypothetical protein [Thiogranum sp.]